ncbi:conserved hypothetical protein [Ignisphaera aggregans DSM 17230]|uniref:Uncharacterized protein n=1 Tax=Ignisphaera aggregans (strain DSM 17230 / JCM 13409 / AQ1.S1) TaxID=583356 RepID=E0SRJ6_IGNAA|nr:conserved hypothetical protein [Ignisphaera aggregans DSM 17230]
MCIIKEVIIIIAFLLLVSTSIIYSVADEGWAIYLNPSNSYDKAFGVCGYGNYIYVVGYDSGWGDKGYRIELYDKNSGRFIKTWRYNPSRDTDGFFDCIVVDGKLYVVGVDASIDYGRWSIYVFDLNLTLLKTYTVNPSNLWDMPFYIVYADGYLYIAGMDQRTNDSEWLVMKIRASDLEIIGEYNSNPSNSWDAPYSMGINPSTGDIWVVGDRDKDYGHIEVLDKNLSIKKFLDTEYRLYGVTFDEDGNVYIVGENITYKFDKYGNIIAKKNIDGIGYKILWNNHYLYIAAEEFVEGYWHHVLYILRDDLEPISKIILSRDVNANAYFCCGGKTFFDGENMFFAGFICTTTSDYKWAIYSIPIYKFPREIGIRTIEYNITASREYTEENYVIVIGIIITIFIAILILKIRKRFHRVS